MTSRFSFVIQRTLLIEQPSYMARKMVSQLANARISFHEVKYVLFFRKNQYNRCLLRDFYPYFSRMEKYNYCCQVKNNCIF
jgi:hypothetical protein